MTTSPACPRPRPTTPPISPNLNLSRHAYLHLSLSSLDINHPYPPRCYYLVPSLSSATSNNHHGNYKTIDPFKTLLRPIFSSATHWRSWHLPLRQLLFKIADRHTHTGDYPDTPCTSPSESPTTKPHSHQDTYDGRRVFGYRAAAAG